MDNKNANGQTGTSCEGNSSGLAISKSENRLIGIKVDSTTAKVKSTTDPKVHAIVKVFHPSMLLAD